MPTCSNSCSEGDSFYNRQVFLRTLIATFVIGLLAHAYCFFNTTFGHDGLYCLTSPSNEVAYKVSLGRFSQYLNFLFRGYVSAPWALGALSLWWLSLGNYCVLRLIRVKELLPLALICGLTVTSIAVTICNATCIHEIDNYALAFFLSALGVYVAVSPRRTWMFAPLIIAFATGLYQAYFSMSCSLAVVYLVLQVLQGRDFKENVRLALKLFGVLVAGILVYALIHKGVLSVFDFEEREAYNGITEATNVSGYVPIVIPLLKGVYKYVFMHFLQPATDHSSLLLLVNLFCAALETVMLFCLIRLRRISWLNVAFLGGLLASLPFAMNLSFFLSKGMIHELMVFAFVLVLILVLLTSLELRAALNRPWVCLTQRVLFVCLGVTIFYQSNFANHAYLQRHLVYQTALSTATRLLNQMENTPGYVLGETPVMVTGTMPQSDLNIGRPGFEHLDGLYGMAPNTTWSYYGCMKAMFKNVLSYPIKFCDDLDAREFELRDEVKAMPEFPHQGYCQMIDGRMVIKLSPPAKVIN